MNPCLESAPRPAGSPALVPTRTAAALAGLVLIAPLLSPCPAASAPPTLTDETSSLFAGSGQCSFCHDHWNRGLLDAQGRDVSIGTDWRGTMMAHSFRDPLWRAVMATEVEARPALRGFIEDKCQTCHAPMARTQARHDGSEGLSFAQANRQPLAADGVSCTLCHQIQPAGLGHAESFTGRYHIGTNRIIHGPYDDVFTRPMQNHVNYTPQFGAHVQSSGLCATCHTLFTPILSDDGRVQGEFPEQTPFLEWTNSVHASRGRQCQDCHMPRLDEPVRISSRPPWLEPRQPYWRHQFVGGNSFMLGLIQENARRTQPQADAAQLDAIIDLTRRQLARAATVVARGRRLPNQAEITVEIENLAGHKFPTGHPYRRAWLHVRLTDERGRTLFESGQPTKDGKLPALADRSSCPDGFAPHRDVISDPGQVQIYEAVMGDARGQPTHGLLQATRYLKDNRLPPAGFRPDGPGTAHTAIRGDAVRDPNFNQDASGRDTVTYRIALSGRVPPGPFTATVRLLYQSVPPEAVAHVLKSRTEPAREFQSLYRKTAPTPELIHSATITL